MNLPCLLHKRNLFPVPAPEADRKGVKRPSVALSTGRGGNPTGESGDSSPRHVDPYDPYGLMGVNLKCPYDDPALEDFFVSVIDGTNSINAVGNDEAVCRTLDRIALERWLEDLRLEGRWSPPSTNSPSNHSRDPSIKPWRRAAWRRS